MARSLPILAALLTACCVPAHAQDEDARGGWFSAALGYGSAKVSCDTCRSGPHLDGWTGLLGFGGTPHPHVRLGAAWEFWENTLPDGETVRVLVTVTGSVYYFPRMWRGPFIEGGLGLSDYRMLKGVHDGVLFLTGDSTYAQGRGWGATVGLGYDVPVGRSSSIRPRVAYTHGDVGTLHSGLGTRYYHRGTPAARRWQQNVLSVSVGMDLASPEASRSSSRAIPPSR